MELIGGVLSPSKNEHYRFDKPLWMGLRKGRFFHAYVVGCTTEFLRYLVGNADHFVRYLDEKKSADAREMDADIRDFRSLATVSSHTHRAGIETRRQEQSLVLAEALYDGLLDVPTLREMLQGPSGRIDAQLMVALEQRLRQACVGTDIWRVFNQATAFD